MRRMAGEIIIPRTEQPTKELRVGQGIHRAKTQVIRKRRPAEPLFDFEDKTPTAELPLDPFALLAPSPRRSTLELRLDDTTPYGYRCPELSARMLDGERNFAPMVAALALLVTAALLFLIAI